MIKWLGARNWFSVSSGLLFAVAVALTGCSGLNKSATNSAPSAPTKSEGAQPEAGVEKAKPAPGTGNVQGKVLYNNQPVANIDIKLCESFNRFMGGCTGQAYTARTDKDGEYLITNVVPKTYEALTARVFDTDSYIFATSGIAGLSAAKYEVAADKTFFVSPIHLFKSDLRSSIPKPDRK